MDLARVDPPWNYDLPALRVVCRVKFGHYFCGSQFPMVLIVMSHPDRLIVGDTKVNANDRAGISTLEFA